MTVDSSVPQDLLRRATAALALCQTLLRARGVFSANEGLDDVSSAGLPFMLVDFVAGEAVGRLKTTGRADRLQRLAEADVRGPLVPRRLASCFRRAARARAAS